MNLGKNFNRFVKVIEIENTSYCNRQCDFCGNAHIDRHTSHHVMEESHYVRFLNDLKQINYSGVLNFNRYNEPFAERIIVRRIALAREILGKNVTLMSFSNSDYLDEVYMKEIEDSGLDILNIQDYSNESDKDKIVQNLLRIKDRLGGNEYKLIYEEDKIECQLTDTKMQAVCIQHRFFDVCGNPRGGTVSQFEKKEYEGPCYRPVFCLEIDYNGNVMPCCNLRSDCEQHKEFILGSIFEENIVNIYFSERAKELRNRLLVGLRPLVCKYCNDTNIKIV